MRSIVLAAAVLAGCGQREPDTIVVNVAFFVEFDAGYSDAGFECVPGHVFCAGSVTWECTYTGKDAIFSGDCASHVDGGYCLEAPAVCPPGKNDVQGPGFSCCDP